jgi:ABC-type molybdate transport system ATPase subunit
MGEFMRIVPSRTGVTERFPLPLDSSNDEAYSLAMALSARNRLEGKIVELQLGGVMAHVVVRVGENLIESVITSAARMR